jgi:hypothetical protein
MPFSLGIDVSLTLSQRSRGNLPTPEQFLMSGQLAKTATAEKNLKTYRLSVCKQQKGCGL